MQRRAAAAYAALFVVLAAGAYGVIALTEQPTVTIANPDQAVATGDHVTLDERTYTVGEVGSSQASLTWINESERQTATIANGTELSPVQASWDGQTARHEAILRNESTIGFQGAEHVVRTNVRTDPPVVELYDAASGNRTTSVEEGGTLAYRGNQTTVTTISSTNVTLAWGDPYVVLVGNVSTASNPSATFRQVLDVAAILAEDPAVENETVTRENGSRYVVYREDGRTELLSAYLPQTDEREVTVGDSFVYQGTRVTVENVSADGVLVAWRGPVQHSRTLSEGATVTIDGTTHATHVSDGTVQFTTAIESYRTQVEAMTTYPERVNGLWGVVILSTLAAVFLLGAAFLPSRY